MDKRALKEANKSLRPKRRGLRGDLIWAAACCLWSIVALSILLGAVRCE